VVLRAAALLEVEAPPPGLYAHLLLLATDEPETALLVDRVTGLRQGGAAALAAPETESLRGVVEGELALDTGTAHLLSLDRLLDRHERQRLAAFAHAEAARRLALEQPL
jgi:chemotaxis signal transduction protein